MIVALAGRRIDAMDTKQHRFPLQNVGLVRERLLQMLKSEAVTVLVCSAACGADLIALSVAGSLGLRRRIVLPFERERFRTTSVVDRPGNWGPIYDQILDEVEASSNLVVIPKALEEEAYSATNRVILEEAIAIATEIDEPISTCMVWNGVSRGENDLTERFGIEARKRGLAVIERMTL